MPPQVKAQAFDPYFTTKPVGQGSGLGLAQVQFFCRQSGGEAQLDSEAGAGTRVRLVLPVSDEVPEGGAPAVDAQGPQHATEGHEVQEGHEPQRPLRVLMVEDDVLVASVVAPALEQAGHRVTLCATADEALGRLAAGAQADVLFTDVVMPGTLSGAELVALCRQRYPALAVIVASGYSEHQAPPGLRVLRKPYRLEQLLQALQQATAAQQPASDPVA
jgi:CheY-like chemotaxis protein